MCRPGVLSSVKLHTLHGSVVFTGVTILLGFVIHHADVVVNQTNLGCYTPLCRFLAMV
jgi:hypothetical protein